ncbi:MAG: TIGR03118 family protein [Chloroflexi bacterium]|nr:MAG: TIGR03118 family protein [Chloroflexota bacterium]
MAIAPPSFGKFAGDLLVGNFGDRRINAYTLGKGNFRGWLRDVRTGGPIAIDGLWALRVGNGGGAPTGGDPNAVYFTAGINGEQDGLFGTITNAGG